MFPVEHLAIIGRDLHLVEQVTGRLTARPPALAGAATGAWLGLFIGLVFWIVSPWGCGAMLSSLPLGIVFGAGWGAAVHLATGDRQHANSLRAMSASRYEIVVDAPYAADALRVLGSPEPV
jgi:hypothetical protein